MAKANLVLVGQQNGNLVGRGLVSIECGQTATQRLGGCVGKEADAVKNGKRTCGLFRTRSHSINVGRKKKARPCRQPSSAYVCHTYAND